MGQQQLLLLVLGIIIVGVAVAVGINMFSSSAVDANRDMVTSDLVNLASKAQQFYKKPVQMGGGGGDFNGFTLGTLDQSNANGAYRLDTAVPAALVAAPPVGVVTIGAAAQTIYVVGYGVEKGRDNTNLVMAYSTVTPSTIVTTVLN